MNCIRYDLNSFPKDFKRNEVVSKNTHTQHAKTGENRLCTGVSFLEEGEEILRFCQGRSWKVIGDLKG